MTVHQSVHVDGPCCSGGRPTGAANMIQVSERWSNQLVDDVAKVEGFAWARLPAFAPTTVERA